MSIASRDPFAVPEFPVPQRQIFVNRTLNLRRLKAIGYDMDYTLIHYNVEQWERRAFFYVKQRLVDRGWPIEHLEFDHEAVIRGLVIDTEMGNLLKVNRFGYVKKAMHGTRVLDYDVQRKTYSRTVVDLADPRYVFLNTFFSVSEAHMYAMLVDMLDRGELADLHSYEKLYQTVRASLDAAHMEGQLKADVVADFERYVEVDPDTPRALLDQKEAGKKLMLITNSWWTYTRQMMKRCFDPYLPGNMVWQELFDIAIVAARKPDFFLERPSLFEVINDKEHLEATRPPLEQGKVYFGGNAALIEKSLGLRGSDILYVGDHVYGDVHVSKSVRRWRTALIVREMEDELSALESFGPQQVELTALMEEKVRREYRMSQVRLNRQRFARGHTDYVNVEVEDFDAELSRLRSEIVNIDDQIRPLARHGRRLANPNWGLLMRAGNDKSYFARQLERHADVYTSRVSNFLFETPFVYLRSPRGSLPHDSGVLLNPYNTD